MSQHYIHVHKIKFVVSNLVLLILHSEDDEIKMINDVITMIEKNTCLKFHDVKTLSFPPEGLEEKIIVFRQSYVFSRYVA